MLNRQKRFLRLEHGASASTGGAMRIAPPGGALSRNDWRDREFQSAQARPIG